MGVAEALVERGERVEGEGILGLEEFRLEVVVLKGVVVNLELLLGCMVGVVEGVNIH